MAEAYEGPSRTESDSMGPIEVPADRYWGAQTQRSLHHFTIGGDHMPVAVIRGMAILKKAAALTNRDLGKDMAEGGFRKDFYYRLCSDIIQTPTLREQVAGSPRRSSRGTWPPSSRCLCGRRAVAPRRT